MLMGVALPTISIPKLSPIAAFSVARPSDAQQRVNTYVLYLDASLNINMLYTDTSSGSPVWKSLQPAALKGVDPNTSIACLTLATTRSNAAQSEQLLEPASGSANRCYFQRSGRVEAQLDGDRGCWTITGNVTIP